MPARIVDYCYEEINMAFEKKNWKNRVAEYINRRVLTKTDGSTEIVTVARSEGMISQEGDAFDAANMNNLEERIADGFSECLRIKSFDASTGTLVTVSGDSEA